jgi:hypothetical protein
MFGSNSVSLLAEFKTYCSTFTFSHLLATSVFIYFIGFIIDGIGLGLDELIFNRLLCKECINKEKRENFFKEVSEHVFEYRNRQWAYYSCYRNLFLLIIPPLFFVSNYFWCKYGRLIGVLTMLLIFLVELIIYTTMRMLINLYYSIEKSF